MKLSFYGGARALTGSCFMLEVGEQNILIDCGLQQGCDEFNDNALEFYASRIDHVLLSNAHIDTTGRLPLLVQEGYYGRIITTSTTKKLMRLILKDSADLQMNDAWWRNQKGLRSGVSPIDPLYSMTDVVATMQQVETEEFNQKFQLCPGVEVRFLPSGHMPGAAIIEIWATEGDETRKIVFSGDLGNEQYAFSGSATGVAEADFLILESSHAQEEEIVPDELEALDDFVDLVDMTLAHAGNVIIPVNAVGRLQELLVAFKKIKKDKLVKSMPQFKVYLDSFLAEDILRIFEGDTSSDLGKINVSDIQGENNPFLFDDLVLCTSAEESKGLNYDRTPKVVLAGSGMCDRGRIQHHLKHNLWRQECTILLLGFLGEGSFGRRLLDGQRLVQVFGEEIMVRAKIASFSCTSGHADRPQLMRWVQGFQQNPKHIFVVQGKDKVCEDFAQSLTVQGFSAHAPLVCEEYDLLNMQMLKAGVAQEARAMSRRGRSYSLPFVRLQDNIRELDLLVRDGKWHTGEEFDTMSKAVREVIAQWDEGKNKGR